MKLSPQIVAPLIVAIIFGVVACIYWPTFSHLLGIAGGADQDTNALVVMLVAFVLIWNMRAALSILPIRPLSLGIIGLIGLGFVWLAGELVFTRVFTQFAVLCMTPMIVLTLLGLRWLRAMAFPFFILMFAVSAWSPLIPVLVKWTAKFSELGIRASGVPIYREGAYFVVPTGSWSVADTCSGVLFLSTSLLLGILYAWTIFQSPIKRCIFIAGAAAIGVVGNWIRVYLTIMIAHISDNRLLRDDHYMFGWWLFAVFLTIYFWLGLRYRTEERRPASIGGAMQGESHSISSQFRANSHQLLVLSVVVFSTLLVWPLLESRLTKTKGATSVDIANLEPAGGWSRVARPSIEWSPEIKNPSRVRVQTFEKNHQYVDVFIGAYRNENWDSKLVTVTNRLAGGDGSKWSLVDRGTAKTEIAGSPLYVKSGVILGKSGRILAWHWYWVDGFSTEGDLRAKFQQLLGQLTSVHAASAWVAIYTSANLQDDNSSILLQEFMRDMGGSLERALAHTAAQ